MNLCVLITRDSNGEIFSITRRKNDLFEIHESSCGSQLSETCAKFRAVRAASSDCSCRCQIPGKKSTFGYFFGDWQCVEGEELRNQERKCNC